MPAIGSLVQLILECGDPHELARFWQQMLDLPPATGDDEWRTLEWAPVGRLSFHRVADYEPPTWPGGGGSQQLHFDLLVDDLALACARAEAAGATALTEVLDPGPKAWRIYADPAGHPFCLVSVPE
ncbi:VOC family protein [Tessaracoccus sp. OH4464_COT-324]|uniref:VOC family protein n=1 Tax=Tessaracoccus sp. OH4464_COT-324 TaxID=2491059 RepID=UPI000F640F88|nr:VOC family protein [Tessaracoccus sp. OH4464_COT-324]RRD45884.1 VOC family protein [Tessaracoccus sp. OH4464_COT-324]